MRVGIIGARGMLGSQLLGYLSYRYAQMLSVFVRDRDDIRRVCLPSTKVFRGSLLNRSDCERFVSHLDVLFYLAHRHSPISSDLDLPSDCLENLLPFLTLLQAVRTIGNRMQVVYFSSGGAIYADRQPRRPFKETDPALPLSSYGIQKLAAENYLGALAQRGHVIATVLRIGNAYGTLLMPGRLQGFLGVAVANALSRRPIPLFGSLSNVRDYVHQEDVCRLAEKCIDRLGASFEIFNCGTQCGHNVIQLLDVIQDCIGRRVEGQRMAIPYANNLPEWSVLDISKARDNLSWSPTITLDAGIREMIQRSLSYGGSKLVAAG